METVGSKIRKYRKEKGITQTELANMIGARQGLIALYETGAKIPNNTTRDKISNALVIPYLRLRDVQIYEPSEEDLQEDGYIESLQNLDYDFQDWIDLVTKCKNSLSDDEFKLFFAETQKKLDNYRIALDMNILIDDVSRYYQMMNSKDIKSIFELPFKYLNKK